MKFFEDAYKISFEGFHDDIYSFRFISVGQKEIIKIVSFSLVESKENWYNLGFGNLEQNESGEWYVNDIAELNNTDFGKVLTTVFNCILYFLHLRPKFVVLFFGNTIHKNDLYKRKIATQYNVLEASLNILGGRIKNEIPLIRKERALVLKNSNSRKRFVYYKDIDSIIGEIETEYIEPFNIGNKEYYQFILIGVK